MPLDVSLSVNQRALWFLHKLVPGSGAYNVHGAVRIEGPLDEDVVRTVLGVLFRTHAALRTTIVEVDGNPRCVVADTAEPVLHCEDAQSLGAAEFHAHLVRAVHAPFDLARGPLLRTMIFRRSSTEHVLSFGMPHIVTDFVSMAIIGAQFFALYQQVIEGRAPTLALPERQATDLAATEEQWLAGADGERTWRHWEAELAGLAVPLMEGDHPRPHIQRLRGATHCFETSPALTRALRQLARTQGTTLNRVLIAAIALVLARHTGSSDIPIGITTSGRTQPGLAGTVGYLANPVIVRVRLDDDPELRDLLRSIDRKVELALAFGKYPFARLVERLKLGGDPGRTPGFQVVFTSFRVGPLGRGALDALMGGLAGGRERLGPLEISSYDDLPMQEGQFDLAFVASEARESVSWSVRFSTDVFEPQTIVRLAGEIERALEAAVATPAARVSTIDLLVPEERARLLGTWNQTTRPCGEGRVEAAIAAVAARIPDATAIVDGGRRLTYRQLDARADALAVRLQALGVTPGRPVAICLERSLEMVVGVYGILKAGGAFVPLDPRDPADRLAFMFSDVGATVVVTQPRCREHVAAAAPGLAIVELDAEDTIAVAAGAPKPVASPHVDDLAYVIYTSGSTGRPKGAMNAHGAVHNRIAWMQARLEVVPGDVFLQKTPCTFDVSVWEYFLPLLAGARLVILPPDAHRDRDAVARAIADAGVTIVQFVPSMLGPFLDAPDLPRCRSLRVIVTGGEALTPELRAGVFERTTARLHNMYGPTEAAIDVTAWECTRDEVGPVPIGRPIANTRIYVLDAHLAPVPIGAPGELHIGGVAVGRGYAGRPDLTAERFIPDPFAVRPGERAYRTGDLTRWRSDGAIAYLGRIDHQVKIRGQRIELGEIESVLDEHPEVADAVVIAREDTPGDRRLVAYFTSRAESSPTPAQLRDFLAGRLAAHAVPAAYVRLATMPLIASGKVDRKALPAPGIERPDLTSAYVAPRDDVEETLARLFAGVLGLDRVGVDDNFFQIGGDSILVLQVVSRARATGLSLSVGEVFEHRTVAALAARLAGRALQIPASTAAPPAGPDTPDGAPFPLSAGQGTMWIASRVDPDAQRGSGFAMRARGPLDVAALGRAFASLIDRHASLRTVFGAADGVPFQRVVPGFPAAIAQVDAHGLDDEALQARLQDLMRRPFDLERGPPFVAELVHRGDEHTLVIAGPHIVADGWSRMVLHEELSASYLAERDRVPVLLPPVGEPYARFVANEAAYLGGPEGSADFTFWRRQLDRHDFTLDLPIDHPRPPVLGSAGAVHPFTLAPDVVEAMQALAAAESTTLFSVLLAAYAVLLARWTGQEDLLVGAPVAARPPGFDRTVGFMQNTVILRARVGRTLTHRDLVRQVAATARAALEHRRFPLSELVQKLKRPRDPSRTPLVQAYAHHQRSRLGDATTGAFELVPVDAGESYAELELAVTQDDARVTPRFLYNTALFRADTIAALATRFQSVLARLVTEPAARIPSG